MDEMVNGRLPSWGANGPTVSISSARGGPGAGSPADIAYVFAPLKHARLDYMVQKAVEMVRHRCNRS